MPYDEQQTRYTATTTANAEKVLRRR